MEQYTIRKIDFLTGKNFIEKYHYTHGCSNSCVATYGLFDKNNLLGVAIFINTSIKEAKQVIFGKELSHTVAEFHRLVIKDGTPCNTESWFIARCLKLLKIERPDFKAVISFADETEKHIGTIYQATNAIYYGPSLKNTFYIDKNKRMRHPRQVGSNSNAKRLGLKISKRLVKHRYAYLLGSSFEKKKLNKLLLIKPLPYPVLILKFICSKCNKEKIAEEFYANKKSKNGLQSQCKDCHKIYLKEKYQNANGKNQK